MLITAETLKYLMPGKVEKVKLLFEIFIDHHNKIATQVGKDIADRTLEKSKSSLSNTQDFLHAQYHIPI